MVQTPQEQTKAQKQDHIQKITSLIKRYIHKKDKTNSKILPPSFFFNQKWIGQKELNFRNFPKS